MSGSYLQRQYNVIPAAYITLFMYGVSTMLLQAARSPHLERPARDIHAAIEAFAPALVRRSGDAVANRFLEFFMARVSNQNTRSAYYHSCCRFFSWCDHIGIRRLTDVSPLHVSAYIRSISTGFARATIKQHLAAIRMLFDWMVLGQLLTNNPAGSVKGPRLDVARGLTTVLAMSEVRILIESIEQSNVVGLRDRALIGTMLFGFSRVSAALSLDGCDYFASNGYRWLRLKEKAGRLIEIPVHPVLKEYLDAYVERLPSDDFATTRLFRTSAQPGKLGSMPMTRSEAYWMVRRRATMCGLSAICCHSFRATGITAFLNSGGLLERAQLFAGHKRLQTTKLYDRRSDELSVSEISKIRF